MAAKIKICGITRETEAEMLNALSADYAGFVLYEKSKRYIPMDKAASCKKRLAPRVRSVAVTVSPSEDMLHRIEEAGFDIIQIHGRIPYDILTGISKPVWMAYQVGIQNEINIPKLPENVTGILLDAAVYGSGRTFSWKDFPIEELERWQIRQLILAGGLNAENVRQGIALFHPQIVDVSSSVEGSSGKDFDKIKEFIRKVREDE